MAQVASGHVNDRPFGRTVFTIGAKRFTGDLVMRQERRAYKVTWRDGFVVAADSPSPADTLGRIGLAVGLVTSAQLSDALRAMTRFAGAKSQLEVLADIAEMSPQEIVTLKRHALVRRTLRVFSLQDATFALDSEPSLAADPEVPPVDPRWLIYKGVRAYYKLPRLDIELALALADDVPFRLVEAAIPSLGAYGFGDAEKPLLVRLRQKPMTLKEVREKVSASDIEATMAILYTLVTTNALEILDTEGKATAMVPPTLSGTAAEAAAARVRAHLQPEPGGAAAPPPAAPVKAPAASPKRPPKPEPTPAPPGTETTAAAEARSIVKSKLADLDADADHFTLLGVTRTASQAEVQLHYFALAKKLHPDRLRALGISDLDSEAQRVFAAINVGFGVLSDAKKRAKYVEVLDAGGEKAIADKERHAEEQAARILGAEHEFQLGVMALRRQHYAKAAESFAKAIELNPDEGEHHAMWAWATWCATADKESIAKDVRQALTRAISMSPKSVPAYFYRGQIAKQQGKRETAIECFRKVLELKSDHHEAEMELRLLAKEKDKKGKGGLFDRLKRR